MKDLNRDQDFGVRIGLFRGECPVINGWTTGDLGRIRRTPLSGKAILEIGAFFFAWFIGSNGRSTVR